MSSIRASIVGPGGLTLGAVCAGASLIAAAGTADAQRRSAPPLVGMTLADTIKPARGFVDRPFVFDGAGGRMLYVNSDGAGMAELRLIDLAQRGVQLASIDISAVTAAPVSVEFLPDGGYFVAGRGSEQGPATAAVIDASGAIKRRFGPATDIALATRDGEPLVVTYERADRKPRRGAPEVHHTVTLHSLADGKARPRKHSLVVDKDGFSAKLDFRLIYWADGYTRAVGRKGGSWDAKENQRSPDTEGWYDLVTGAFARRLAIDDFVDHARRMQILSQHHNEGDFVAVPPDGSGLYYMTAASKTKVALAEPFESYDAGSLVYQPSRHGTIFFTLKIDPANPRAVAQKRVDPEYLDLYEYTAGKAAAVRRARLLLDAQTRRRTHSWRATSELWVIVPRQIGFTRGGVALQVYQLAQR